MPTPLAMGLLGLLAGVSQGYGQRKVRKREEKKQEAETARKIHEEELAREERRQARLSGEGEFALNKAFQEEQLSEQARQFNVSEGRQTTEFQTGEKRRAGEFAATSAENTRQFNVKAGQDKENALLKQELQAERNQGEMLRILSQISSKSGNSDPQAKLATDALLRSISAGGVNIRTMTPEKSAEFLTNLRAYAKMAGINPDVVDIGGAGDGGGNGEGNGVQGDSSNTGYAAPIGPGIGAQYSPHLDSYIFPYESLLSRPNRPSPIPVELMDLLSKKRNSDSTRTLR